MYSEYEKLRNAKGLSDYAVSKQSGVAPTIISDWKRGRSTPKIDKLIKIAAVIDCDVLTLVDKE